MFQRIGHPVQKLRRVAIGPLSDPDLRLGAVRELTERELAQLRKAAGPRGAAAMAPKGGGSPGAARARKDGGKPRGAAARAPKGGGKPRAAAARAPQGGGKPRRGRGR